MKNILGIGNALVDILIRTNDDNLLKKYSLPKGSMQLVNKETAENILLEIYKNQLSSGGSAANTIHGLARLGVNVGYIGKIGNDDMGEFFQSDMENNNINTFLLKGENNTGKAITFISQDSERTFATYLGAAIELTASDLNKNVFEGYNYFYAEGYLVQNHELIETALKIAKDKNLKIVLDLASYNVVESNLEFLQKLVKEYVDIVFANEEEAEAFTQGKQPVDALDQLAEITEIAIVKIGDKGSLVKRGDDVVTIDPIKVKPIDTTGAGDLYASGFLYGLINNMALKECGRIASLLSGKVTEVIGPKLTNSTWNEILDQLNR